MFESITKRSVKITPNPTASTNYTQEKIRQSSYIDNPNLFISLSLGIVLLCHQCVANKQPCNQSSPILLRSCSAYRILTNQIQRTIASWNKKRGRYQPLSHYFCQLFYSRYCLGLKLYQPNTSTGSIAFVRSQSPNHSLAVLIIVAKRKRRIITNELVVFAKKAILFHLGLLSYKMKGVN